MQKKILIATGGTGGHIYPAVAFAQKILTKFDHCEVLFIGGGIEQNKYLKSYTYNKQTVSTATVNSKSPFKLLLGCANIAKGVWQSRSIIKKFKPDIAVGFGSYYSIPPMIAAKMQSIPIVLHEANSIPGKANKLLAPFADVIGVHFPETLKSFNNRSAVEVGMPLRDGYEKGSLDKAIVMQYYGLEQNKRTMLVFGGSQGAKIINQNVISALELLKDKSSLQVIHITGDSLSEKEMTRQYAALKINAHVKAFENRMDMAWQAADTVICRAGASTVAEMFEFEVPGILIPYQNAADSHQEHNAHFIVNQVQASFMLREKELNEMSLYSRLSELLDNDSKKLTSMKKSIVDYKAKYERQDLCSLVLKVLS